MQLEKEIQEQLNEIVKSGKVSEMIKKHLETTLDSIIKDSLREYSDFGKSVKNVVSKALNLDLTKLEMIHYNEIVKKVITDRLNGHFLQVATKPIEQHLDKYLGCLPKNKYKLSEVVEMFLNEVKGEKHEQEGSIFYHLEKSSHGFIYVYLDDDRELKRYSDAEYFIHTYKGKVCGFNAGNYHPYRGNIIQKSPDLTGFSSFIFKLYAMDCEIEFDEQFVETEWYND